MKKQGTTKLVEKAKGGYASRYTSNNPDLNMKEQKSSAYKSRYSSALAPDGEIVIKKKKSYSSRY